MCNTFFVPIADITPFTLLDFPKHLACIFWVQGCNMRCPYCHNPGLIPGGRGKISPEQIRDFMQSRRKWLDGIVISGGEATLYPGTKELAAAAKTLGYAVKLDTNGSRPERLKQMIEGKLLDMVALDYKAPPEKSRQVTGANHSKALEQSLDILCSQNDIAVEIRTTVHTDLLDESDIAAIMSDLDRRGFTGTYAVQNFRDVNEGTLGKLPPQGRVLDISRLPSPRNFQLEIRNFS